MSTLRGEAERLDGGSGSDAIDGKTTSGIGKQAEDEDGKEGGPSANPSSRDPMISHNDKDDDEPPEDDEQKEEHDETYPQPDDAEALLPPPDFKPFFTIVDEESGEHHHPTVHYIFADDDQDILTSATLETLNPSHGDGAADERFVIIDLSADGKEVVSAFSLSPDWQALRTKIGPAPSWGGEDEQSTNRGLMLRISGQEARRQNGSKRAEKKGDIEDLLKAFDEQLESLDGVLGSANDDKDTQVALQEQPPK